MIEEIELTLEELREIHKDDNPDFVDFHFFLGEYMPKALVARWHDRYNTCDENDFADYYLTLWTNSYYGFGWDEKNGEYIEEIESRNDLIDLIGEEEQHLICETPEQMERWELEYERQQAGLLVRRIEELRSPQKPANEGRTASQPNNSRPRELGTFCNGVVSLKKVGEIYRVEIRRKKGWMKLVDRAISLGVGNKGSRQRKWEFPTFEAALSLVSALAPESATCEQRNCVADELGKLDDP